MTLKPCLVCGEPGSGPRCQVHTVDRKRPAADRGYDQAWRRLSARARKLQPFCTDCGEVDDLQLDHSPEAWAAKAAGKAITLAMTEVVCGPCNRLRGAARGDAVTRGDAPPSGHPYPRGRQNLSERS